MEGITKIPYDKQVADKIIEALKDGTAPWIKPWKGEELFNQVPINLTTGKPYNGMNFVNLFMEAFNKGYSDPRWMTFNQGKSIGAYVNKGEKSSLVKVYKFTKQVDMLDDKGKKILDEQGKPKKEIIKLEHPTVVWHRVFNAEQFNNVPSLEKENIEFMQREFNPIEQAETMLNNSQANIFHKEGNKAYYSLSEDKIVLPLKEQFEDELSYYSTALHELAHWTGHENRLDRDMGEGYGTPSYAKEELRAEISSFMLCSKLGLDFDPGQHFSYINSWVKMLEDDSKEITRASSDAMKISNYIQTIQKEQMIEQSPNVIKDNIMEQKISTLLVGDVFRKDIDSVDYIVTKTYEDSIEAIKSMSTKEDLNNPIQINFNNKNNLPNYIYLKENILLKEIKTHYKDPNIIEKVSLMAKTKDITIKEVNEAIIWCNLDTSKSLFPLSKELETINAHKSQEQFNNDQKEQQTIANTIKENSILLSERDKVLSHLKNNSKPGILLDNEANHLINNFGVIQSVSPLGHTHTELDISGVKVLLFQRDNKGEIHSSFEKRENMVADFFKDLKKYHSPGTTINTKKETMVVLQKNDLLLEVRTLLNKGEHKNLNTTLNIAKNTSKKDVQKSIKWIEDTLNTRLKKGGPIHDSLQNLKMNYENIIIKKVPTPIKDESPKKDVFTTKTYLVVPFEQKEAAKRAAEAGGVKIVFDDIKKAWYAPPGADKNLLSPWLVENQEIKNMTNNNTITQDPEVELKERLESYGLIIDGLPEMDGKMHRVATSNGKRGDKKGWYVGYKDGVPNARFGDWSQGETQHWKSNVAFTNDYDPKKAAELEKANALQRKEAEKEQKLLWEETSKSEQNIYKNAKNALSSHPYLKAKKIQNYNLKVDNRNNLLIPLYDIDGKHWSNQRINVGFKQFIKGGKKAGNFHIIGEKDISRIDPVILVEGYSTGASVHEATKKPVIVAMDAGNLEKVAKDIKSKYPTKDILVAGDNDIAKKLLAEREGKIGENKGEIKARATAEAIKGDFVIPTFTKKELDLKASDWNDLASHRGLDEVKNQLDVALQKMKTNLKSKEQEKMQEKNQTQQKQRKREVVRKQSLGMTP